MIEIAGDITIKNNDAVKNNAVMLERINNLKEYVRERHDENKKISEAVFKLIRDQAELINANARAIAVNKTQLIVGGTIILVMIGMLANILIGWGEIYETNKHWGAE